MASNFSLTSILYSNETDNKFHETEMARFWYIRLMSFVCFKLWVFYKGWRWNKLSGVLKLANSHSFDNCFEFQTQLLACFMPSISDNMKQDTTDYMKQDTTDNKVGWLCWGLTSQSTIFKSCRDGATASWVINQYFRGVKCLAQGHNTAAVGFEPPTSRSGVRHSTTEPPRSPWQ